MDDLERRSERIERQAVLSLHAHCPDAARAALGLALDEVGGALVASATADSSVLLNRTLGLGVERPATLEDARAVVDTYARRGIGKYFLHVHPDTLAPGVHDVLPGMGLQRGRGWRKFHRGVEPPPAARTALRVERIGPDRAEHFGRIAAPAFGLSEAAVEMAAGLARDPRWHLYVSYAGDTPAGTGAMLVVGEDALCEWGATAPAFRRQGSQGAIMAARIRAALDAGCKHLFTETGEAVEGDPQHSYRNIERYGFVAGPVRENWLPA